MLHIPAPTVQDRANQWAEAYNAAEGLFVKVFKNDPQRASEAGKKGGQNSHGGGRKSDNS